MLRKHYPVWIIALLIVALTAAACAPRAGGGAVLKMEGAENLAVDLPSLVIDFDAQGQPSIADMALLDLSAQFAPGALDSFVLPADAVQFMTENGIQHIQVANGPEGLLVLVNGMPVPSIKWDGERLQNTTQLINVAGVDLGEGMAAIETLLPLVSHLGIGVIARFPVADNMEIVSVDYDETQTMGMASKEAQESFLQTVKSPPSIVVPVFYDAQGSWRVGDLSSDEWISLTGMPVFDSFRLRPEVVDRLMDQGVTEFALWTDAQGVHVSINGKDMPYIGWEDGELSNVLALAEQMGLWQQLGSTGMNVDDLAAMVDTLLPVVQTTEISLTAHFPEDVAVASN